MKKILPVILVLTAAVSCAEYMSGHDDRYENSEFETREYKHGRGRKGHHHMGDHSGRGIDIYENMPLETKNQVQDVKSQYRLDKEKLQSAHHIAILELDTKIKKLLLQMDEAEKFDPKLVLQYEELRTQAASLRSEYHQQKLALKEKFRTQAQKIRVDWLKTQV